MTTYGPSFFIKGKPLSIVDAINRMAAATGSIRYAMATADADYNGHPMSLYWNDYRGYYVLDYHWGERVVLHRGIDFAAALTAGKRELARQGRGASLRISPRQEDVELARADAELTEGNINDVPDTRKDAWKFKNLHYVKLFNASHLLVKCETEEEFRKALKLS